MRSLWVVAAGLLGWSVVMAVAERVSRRDRAEADLTLIDGVVIGLVQCLSLVAGVSRSGATISAGLMRHLDRVAATRLAFLLSVPALVAAWAYEGMSESSAISATVGWPPTIVGLVVSFAVASASVAWLLRFVTRHPITVFIWYRVVWGLVICALLVTGTVTAS